MFTDTTFFVAELEIAQLTNQANKNLLAVFINRREPEYLAHVLGYEFYSLFKEEISGTSPDQRWKDIRDGVDYRDSDGKLKHWIGFTNDAKQSPIANYIYWWWHRNQQSYPSGAGEVTAQSQNAAPADVTMKLVRAWNEMVDWTNDLHKLLQSTNDAGDKVYEEFDPLLANCYKYTGWL